MTLEILFETLTEAVTGSPVAALAAALAWGVLSIVLSPCHLASIPLIVGFLQGETGSTKTRRAAFLSSLFALGILVSIAAIGAATASAGRMLGDLGPWGNYAVAVVFFAFGLHLLDILPLPSIWRPKPNDSRRGPLGALVFGIIFGVALGPCTFGFMAPVLGVTFQVAPTSPGYALGLLASFGLGHCLVIAIAGTSSSWIQNWLSWQGTTLGVKWLRRFCGALVFLGGIYLVATV